MQVIEYILLKQSIGTISLSYSTEITHYISFVVQIELISIVKSESFFYEICWSSFFKSLIRFFKDLSAIVFMAYDKLTICFFEVSCFFIRIEIEKISVTKIQSYGRSGHFYRIDMCEIFKTTRGILAIRNSCHGNRKPKDSFFSRKLVYIKELIHCWCHFL